MAPVRTVPLHETTRERYLNYALSVITSRALPDIRDGLKPVQRRILYAMFASLKLYPDRRYRKSAAIVGDTMGKYHPHGDGAIYESMVRMAQDFKLRDPLVDGHGNFGSIDGDSAAAMRYTEARLLPLAMEMLEELRQDTVPFRPTFDGILTEPVVLPSRVPNLLVNGCEGIAVGMRTSIPPHNLGEVLGAALYMVDCRLRSENNQWPKTRIATLVKRFIQGPDFPTGARVLNTEEQLIDIYSKGKGTISVRSDFVKEGKQRLVITSIPYAVNKGDLVGEIATQIAAGKPPQLLDVRDESAKDIRIVLELKRGSSAEAALGYLFKKTKLSQPFHVNLTALYPTGNEHIGAPATFDLRSALEHFLEFRLTVVTRRLRHELELLEKRIHVLEGFEIVFDALDEAIRIIRSSKNRAESDTRLRNRFDLTSVQSYAILETRLYKLSQMEIAAIEEELRVKRARADEIRQLLLDEVARWKLVRSELRDMRTRYATPRRTVIAGPDNGTFAFTKEDLIVDEAALIVVTRGGWIKRQGSYTTLESIRVRENDQVGWVLPGRTRSTVSFWTNFGRAYTARVNAILMTSGYGTPIQALFDFSDKERIVGVTSNDEVAVPKRRASKDPAQSNGEVPPRLGYVVSVAKGGWCLRQPLDAFAQPSTRVGRYFMRPADGDEVIGAWPAGGAEYVCVASRRGKGLAFEVGEIPLFKGAARGVKSLNLDNGDELLGAYVAARKSDGLTVVTARGRQEIVRATKSYLGRRATKGRAIIKRGQLGGIVERTVEPKQV